jgi:hypothetical protein
VVPFWILVVLLLPASIRISFSDYIVTVTVVELFVSSNLKMRLEMT